MKSILCFGDSNTWGYDPATKTRFSRDKRWTGLLQKYLGNQYYIVEEGLNGRTTNIDEKEKYNLGYSRKNRNSLDLLPGLIESHYPLDLIVVMLGTNDLKSNFNHSANQIASNMKLVCQAIITHECFNSKSLLLISPTHIEENSDIILWDGMFRDKDLIDKKGWGHSSIEQGAEFFNKVNCKKMLITHHAPGRTDYELDKINSELPDGIELAFDGMTIEVN